ncbi:ervatamin-B-like [Phragmites australis]|uniref:ervatamin-B-like n=1 Tax=Phragmites australis TaxID=29695 RepID=UPI002D78C9CA|nr:ervatamin-B-like [Phragmites australis]
MAASSSFLALLLLTICCGLLTSSWATSSRTTQEDLLMDRFHCWMERHNRSYPTADEKLRRFEVYRRNVEHIEATNREGKLSYTLGENQFTDLTSEEFLATYTGRVVLPEVADDEDGGEMVITTLAGDVTEGGNAGHVNVSALPESIDWRKLGAVTPVKNQGQCGSCYAFAVVAAVEGLHQIKTGKLVTLSEQQLVDCASFGCSTGISTGTFTWIRKNGGITTEADYPYTGQKGTCDAAKLKHHAVTIRDYRALRNNERKLMETVAQQPVTVAIEASAAFQDYQGGVFSGPCGFVHNHIVTIVGYGKDAATGKKYWIVKNSYGQSWGMGGYILMEKDIADPRGLCNLAFYPVYPIM